jgi:transposase-like protein
VAEERAELAALRKELRVVKMERDILGKAVAFFAKENA